MTGTVVNVPGSKSIANRALVCAALADTPSTLRNVPDGDDTVAMIRCLTGLGVTIAGGPPELTVTPPSRLAPAAGTVLHAALAGTTSRFVTAVAALAGVPVTVDGDPPLRARPFGPLHDALTGLGVRVTPGERPGGLPVTLLGPPTGGRVALPGDVSSQFVSALMLIGPRLPDGLELELTSALVSRPYVELTASVMAGFGVDGVRVSERRIEVPAASYRGAEMFVEPDASSASYPLAWAAITGTTVTVAGLGRTSRQGDARFAELLAEMGCAVEITEAATTVRGPARGELRGIDVDMADISDLVPTVAVVAACAGSPTRIRGVGFIRAKESDRLGDLAAELTKAGVTIEETDDGLRVEPSAHALRRATLGTHHDHRLAMAFGVLAAVVPGGLDIADPAVVSKSWPGYWHAMGALA